ncbi:GNAT family protein (plasmid) [Kocuria rhizophila]|nr:GNAT family protein [Kocuria rhizophila]
MQAPRRRGGHALLPREPSRATRCRGGSTGRRTLAKRRFGLWVIEHRTTGGFIGDCGLTWRNISAPRSWRSAARVLIERQGRGNGVEGACRLPAMRVRPSTQKMITAIINPDNMASRRVAERIGVTVEGAA